MKIEVGKLYRDHKGVVYKIITDNAGGYWSYVGEAATADASLVRFNEEGISPGCLYLVSEVEVRKVLSFVGVHYVSKYAQTAYSACRTMTNSKLSHEQVKVRVTIEELPSDEQREPESSASEAPSEPEAEE